MRNDLPETRAMRNTLRCAIMAAPPPGALPAAPHFWVGEFGGWVRCYDRQGQHQARGDLGGGTVKYLGHGVAACDALVATGAWDVVTIFPKNGAPPKNVKPAVPGNP